MTWDKELDDINTKRALAKELGGEEGVARQHEIGLGGHDRGEPHGAALGHGREGRRTVALLDKAPRRIVDVPVDYRGFEVGDEFLLGYGLDWQGRYRNLPSLWAIMDMEQLADLDSTFPSAVFADG